MTEVVSESILTKFETSSNYKIEECLGRGAYGLVFLVDDIKSGQKLAAKLVMKSTSGERDLWSNLHHPNLLPLIRTDELSESCIVHLMPYVGCDLFHMLHEKVPSFHDSRQCFLRKKNYVRDVLKGLEYMHSRNICHLDLKVENILICYKKDVAIIGDFSTLISADDFCNVIFGLNMFALPPEVAKQRENFFYDVIAAEMWTFGILMLQMFTMKFNFRDNQGEDTYEKDILPRVMSSTFHKDIRKSLFRLHKNACISSEDASQYFSFISQFLVLHPQSRFSATKALNHPFLTVSEIQPERKNISLKQKAPEKEMRSLFERMSLFESNTTKRSILTIEKRRLIEPKKTYRCYTLDNKSKIEKSSGLNTLEPRRLHSWPIHSGVPDAELLKRISKMVQNTKSEEKVHNRSSKKIKIIEEETHSIASVSGDCLNLKRSRIAKSIRKYKIRFRHRKPRAILPNFSKTSYHKYDMKPEIQFSLNPSTSGSVMKFTGTNKPGVVKKRAKKNTKWSITRIWRSTNVKEYYDSFADNVILLPKKKS